MPTSVSSQWPVRRLLSLLAASAAITMPASASAGVGLSTSGWEWSDPSPQGYTLGDVQFAGARGYAVGSGGTALRTDDGGATWSGLFTGTGTYISSVDVVDPNTLVVSSGDDANCSLRISRDGGATFTLISVADDESSCASSAFVSYDFVSAQQGYVMRTGGAVIATDDGGASFGSRSAVDGGQSLRFVDALTGYAVGGNSVYRTTDGAQTWTPIFNAGGALTRIRVIDAQHLIAWGADRLVRSVDGGATWQAGTIAGDPTRVSWSDPDHLAFVSDHKLLLSDDGGLTVRSVTLGNNDVLSAAYVDASRIVAVGSGGVTYTSVDGGLNFARLSSDRVEGSLRAVVESGGGPIGLGDGKIGRIVSGRWVLNSTLSSAAVEDADFSSAQRGYVVRAGNTILRTLNNGVTWSQVDPGTSTTISRILTPNDDTTLLLGGFGVLRATNGGAFAKVTAKLVAKLHPAGANHVGGRVVAWDRSAKVRPVASADGGATWKAITMPKGVKVVSDLRPLPSRGLLLLSGGRAFRSSTDAGKWTEIVGAGASIGGRGPGIRAASRTEFFAGGGSSWPFPVVLHSTDAGATWQPQAVGARDSSIATLAAAGPKTAYVLSRGSEPFRDGLFQTTTGGSRGTVARLSLARTKAVIKAAGGRITLTGQLSGGRGGEDVHIALRKVGAAAWSTQMVTVGANGGGSFTASFRAKKGKYVAVAQWAGDSGRAGSGTPAKVITVK